MRTISIVTRLDVSAEHYWALRDDVGFDHFCACEDGASYQVHEKTTDSRGRTVVDASYVYEKVPAAMAPAVGSLGVMDVRSVLRYWPEAFSADTPATFETTPSLLGGRVSGSTTCYLTRVSDSACDCHLTTTVEARVLGIGRFIESIWIHFLRENYVRLNGLTVAYLCTESGSVSVAAEARRRSAAAATAAAAAAAVASTSATTPSATPSATAAAAAGDASGGAPSDDTPSGTPLRHAVTASVLGSQRRWSRSLLGKLRSKRGAEREGGAPVWTRPLAEHASSHLATSPADSSASSALTALADKLESLGLDGAGRTAGRADDANGTPGSTERSSNDTTDATALADVVFGAPASAGRQSPEGRDYEYWRALHDALGEVGSPGAEAAEVRLHRLGSSASAAPAAEEEPGGGGYAYDIWL